jgi:hypothetical protein
MKRRMGVMKTPQKTITELVMKQTLFVADD